MFPFLERQERGLRSWYGRPSAADVNAQKPSSCAAAITLAGDAAFVPYVSTTPTEVCARWLTSVCAESQDATHNVLTSSSLDPSAEDTKLAAFETSDLLLPSPEVQPISTGPFIAGTTHTHWRLKLARSRR